MGRAVGRWARPATWCPLCTQKGRTGTVTHLVTGAPAHLSPSRAACGTLATHRPPGFRGLGTVTRTSSLWA